MTNRYWGTYVFKLENYKPIIIEIPHPSRGKQPMAVINLHQMEGQILNLSFEEVDSKKIYDFVRKHQTTLVISN